MPLYVTIDGPFVRESNAFMCLDSVYKWLDKYKGNPNFNWYKITEGDYPSVTILEHGVFHYGLDFCRNY